MIFSEKRKHTIKALECCAGKEDCDCSDCPFYEVVEDCEVELPERALDVINYYKKENERLKTKVRLLNRELKDCKKQSDGLKNKIDELYKEMVRIAKCTVVTQYQPKESKINNLL